MTPGLALRLSIALALIGAGALVPLLGLFGTPLFLGTLPAVVAISAIIAAFVLAGEVGPGAVGPAWLSRLLNIMTSAAALSILADAVAQVAFPESSAAAWFDRADDAFAMAVVKLPLELVLLVPAFAVIVALRRKSHALRLATSTEGTTP